MFSLSLMLPISHPARYSMLSPLSVSARLCFACMIPSASVNSVVELLVPGAAEEMNSVSCLG